MYFDTVYQVDAQTAFGQPEAFPQVEAISNKLANADDLGVAFSRIGQEVPAGSQVEFRIVLDGPPLPLQSVIKEEVYRIGREALLNAFRHSHASRVELYLEYAPTGLRMAVIDNGKGISAELLQAGCDGLSWMKGLAERIGGKLKLLSRVTAGTEVLLSIPGHVAFASQTRGSRA